MRWSTIWEIVDASVNCIDDALTLFKKYADHVSFVDHIHDGKDDINDYIGKIIKDPNGKLAVIDLEE